MRTWLAINKANIKELESFTYMLTGLIQSLSPYYSAIFSFFIVWLSKGKKSKSKMPNWQRIHFCSEIKNKMQIIPLNTYLNKTVLLHERKRHTAHHVVSTPSVLSWGYPILAVGYPIPGQGVSSNGVPFSWDWGTPRKVPGTSHWGTARKDMVPVKVLWGDGAGAPLPPVVNTCENSTFPSHYVRGR